MNCKEAEELIFTYRESSDSERKKVQEHIRSCRACETLYAEQQKMADMLASVSAVEIAPLDKERLTEKIMEAVNPTARQERIFPGILNPFNYIRTAMSILSVSLILLFAAETGVLSDDKPIDDNQAVQKQAILKPLGISVLKERKETKRRSLYAMIKENEELTTQNNNSYEN